MERKVGEIFEYNGEWYQCIVQPKGTEGQSCSICSMNFGGKCPIHVIECAMEGRSDGKSVIFKKLEKVGEPFVYEDKVLQRLRSIDGYSCVHCLFKEQACNFDSCDKDSFLVETKKSENMEEKKLTYDELEHYYDSTCGLWAIDRNPKEVTLEWIVENVFQLGDTIPEKVCASNLKPFDLEAAKAGKPVCTRDGRKARIICWDKKGNYPIVALIQDNENSEHIEYYTENGIFSNGGNEKNRDLMMLPEKKEGWVNVYKSDNNKYSALLGSAYVYKTKAEAELNFDKDNGLAIVKIEWEE